MMPILEVKNLIKQFGGLIAVNDVSFEVNDGDIHGLIGPNGAGKSTTFKIVAGFMSPTEGDVLFHNSSIKGQKPSTIATLGIARTFQETTLFQELSVFNNILIGVHKEARTDIFSALLGLDHEKQQAASEATTQVIEFMGLSDRQNQLAAELPLGYQRILAISIALASKPSLLLMDEPFAGMNPEETRHMMELTRKVRETGITIVLVEHNMNAIMGLCDRLTVLNFGTVLDDGTPEQVRNNPDVIQAYLGGS